MKNNGIKVNMYGETSKGTSYSFEKYKDKEIEKLWDELEDVLFVEEENGTLVLASEWNGFDAGTDRETIWYWFDEHHSKGVGYLLNEYEPE